MGPDDNRAKKLLRGCVASACAVAACVLPAVLLLPKVQAAQISFAPNGLTVKVAPGETVAVPIAVSLEDTSLPNSYASFGLAHVGGSLDRNWINSQVYMSLNSWYKTRQAVLQVKVPAGAQRRYLQRYSKNSLAQVERERCSCRVRDQCRRRQLCELQSGPFVLRIFPHHRNPSTFATTSRYI